MKKVWLILPAVLLFVLFIGWPLIGVIRLSLYETNFIKESWIGLKNYRMIFQNEEFLMSIGNSFWYSILIVLGQVGISVLISLIVFNLPKLWQDISRIVLYIPVLSAGIIISQSWKWIYHINGPLNWLMSLIGVNPISFFSSPVTAIPAISLVVISAGIGSYVIILLASISSVDHSIIESARMDGASWFLIKIKIILPIIYPTIGMIVLLSMIGSLQVFETIYALAPYDYSSTITFHIYREGFQYSKYGWASAQSVLLLFFTVCLSLIKNKIGRSSKE